MCVCRLTAEKVRVDWHGPREEEEEEEVTHIFLLFSLSIPSPAGICLLRYLFLRHFLEAGGGRGMKYLRLGIRPAKGRKCDIFIA